MTKKIVFIPDHSNVLVLAPVGVPVVTRGSVQIQAACGHMAWISRNAQDAYTTDPTLFTLCMPCFQDSEDENPDEVEYRTMPGAALELADALNIPLDEVDALMTSAVEKVKAIRGHRPE